MYAAALPNWTAILSAFLRRTGICLVLAFSVAACGNAEEREVKALKEQVQRATGQKDYRKLLESAQKGLALSQKTLGDKAPDTLYFAQGVTEGYLNTRNFRAAITAMRKELDMRSAAGQTEQKLQPRRTLLIQLAEENGDKMTAADQAVAVAKGIDMGPGKDPQPVYRSPTAYPPNLYRDKVEGDVEISFSIDSAGLVTEAHVSRATPANVFDQAALESFKKWRFTPMLDRTGHPVPAAGLNFTLAFRMGRQ
jgi:TonB family protein